MEWDQGEEEPTEGSELISEDDQTSDSEMVIGPSTSPLVAAYPPPQRSPLAVDFCKDVSIAYNDLQRMHWVLHPGMVARLLEDATKLVRAQLAHGEDAYQPTPFEGTALSRLLRLVVPQAFAKLDDRAVRGWASNIQHDIQMMSMACMELAAARLERWHKWKEHVADGVRCVPTYEKAGEWEEELLAVLKGVGDAVNPECEFHRFNAECPAPSEFSKMSGQWAGALRAASNSTPKAVSAADGGVAADSSDEEEMIQPRFSWAAALINRFGEAGGFDALQQVVAWDGNADALNVTLLERLLTPFAAAVTLLKQETLDLLAQACMDAVRWLEVRVKDDPDKLSDRGTDKGLSSVSTLFNSLHVLLQRKYQRSKAEKIVSPVQRQFVEKLLSASTFSRQLSAVRETDTLLTRAAALRKNGSTADAAAMREMTEWLRAKDIIGGLLRANLHLAQYVAQVQKVLMKLAEEGALEGAHIQLIWSLTEKAETFEVVKSNLYSSLGQLATVMDDKHLDFLFQRFESARSRPLPDTLRLFELLQRLVLSDMRGVLADRVMHLLYTMAITPGHLEAMTKAREGLRSALSCYNKALGDDRGNVLAGKYMNLCVTAIQKDHRQRAALYVLQDIITTYPDTVSSAGDVPRKSIVKVIEKQMSALDLMVQAIESHAAEMHGLRLPEALVEGRESIEHYLEFYTLLVDTGELTITWEHVDRLWAALANAADGLRDLLLAFFGNGIATGRAGSQRPLPTSTVQRLLTERLVTLAPEGVSPVAWKCLDAAIHHVALQEAKLVVVQDSKSLQVMDPGVAGLGYLWAVALNAPDEVASQAHQLLVVVHTDLAPDLDASAVRSSYLQQCHAWLMQAVEEASSDARAAIRCARCLTLINNFARRHKARLVPKVPAHSASFMGELISLSVALNGAKVSISTHTNAYIGSLRQQLASQRGGDLPPEMLRLFVGGRELLCDSALVSEVGLGHGHVMHAQASPKSFSGAADADAVPADGHDSPVAMVTQLDGVYETLLQLGDACPAPATRREILHLLDVLPTWPAAVQELTRALSAPDANLRLLRVLSPPASDGQPTAAPLRLLYSLQTLSGLLFPVSPAASAGASVPSCAALRSTFEASGCLLGVLQAYHAACEVPLADPGTLRALSGTALRLLLQLMPADEASSVATVPAKAAAARADAADTGASDMTVPNSGPDPRQSPVSVSMDQAPTSSPSTSSGMAGGKDSVPGSPAREALTGAPLGAEAPRAVMRFLVAVARGAACGWGSTSKSDSAAAQEVGGAEDDDATERDAATAQAALAALTRLLTDPRMLQMLIQEPGTEAMAQELLLHPTSEALRRAARQLLERVADTSGRAHAWLLSLLLRSQTLAEAQLQHCTDFYLLFAHAVTSLPTPSERELAEKVLDDLCAALPDLTPADEADALRCGKLSLALELVRSLDRHDLTTPAGNLVKLLIEDFLFPESVALAEQRPLHQLPAESLSARCGPKNSRQAAFRLLGELMIRDGSNLATGTALLKRLHFSKDRDLLLGVNNHPDSQLRRPEGFVGIKNGGATCYMNSLFQQLFMQPSIRAFVLAGAEVPQAERRDSVFYQLQRMFAHLELSRSPCYSPEDFWAAFKDYDGEPVNVREHEDAYEFFTRLQDMVDQYLTSVRAPKAIAPVIDLTLAQQVICPSVPHQSERLEPAQALSLDVDKGTLAAALDFYTKGELLEGDNQYFCDAVGKKVDAIMRQAIKELPHMLVLHLKRFEWDFETETRFKKKDRFEFPLELDMYRYTLEGLAEAEAASSPSEAAPAKPLRRQPPEYYQYQLKGVVVHSGTAFAGHYYSYIKERKMGGGGTWHCFDDNAVDPWDVACLEKDCYGGRFTADVWDAKTNQHVPHEYDRPNSAFMLFYERSEELEPCRQPQPQPASAEQPSGMTGAAPLSAPQQSSGLEEPMRDTQSSGGAPTQRSTSAVAAGLTTAPEAGAAPAAASTAAAGRTPPVLPSLYADVMEENLALVERIHLLDADYLSFGRQLVEEAAQLCSAKVRRTDTPTASGGSAGAAAGGGAGGSAASSATEDASATSGSGPGRAGLTRRPEQAAATAGLAMDLAVGFLFRILIRADPTLQTDLPRWRSAVAALEDAEPSTCRVLLQTAATLPGKPHLALRAVMAGRQTTAELHAFVRQLLVDALRAAVRNDNGMPDPDSGDASGTAQPIVADFIEVMCEALSHAPLQKFTQAELAAVLSEYASLARHAASHLILLEVPFTINEMFLPHFQRHAQSAQQQGASFPDIAALIRLYGLIARQHTIPAQRSSNVDPALPNAHARPDPIVLKSSEHETARSLAVWAPEWAALACTGTVDYIMDRDIRDFVCWTEWEHEKASVNIVDALWTTLETVQVTQLRAARTALAQIFSVPDSLRRSRIQYLLMGNGRGGFSAHSLLHQLSDEEPTVVAELVALITDLEPEDGVAGLRQMVRSTPRGIKAWRDALSVFERVMVKQMHQMPAQLLDEREQVLLKAKFINGQDDIDA